MFVCRDGVSSELLSNPCFILGYLIRNNKQRTIKAKEDIPNWTIGTEEFLKDYLNRGFKATTLVDTE